jgi:hypothetical protein
VVSPLCTPWYGFFVFFFFFFFVVKRGTLNYICAKVCLADNDLWHEAEGIKYGKTIKTSRTRSSPLPPRDVIHFLLPLRKTPAPKRA